MSPHQAANEHQMVIESSLTGKAERHMAGKRQTAWIAAASIAIMMAGQMGAATVAAAQSVPLPPPAPLPKTGAAPQPPGAIPNAKGPGAQGSQKAQSDQKAPSGEQQAQSSSPLQQLQQWLPPIFGGGDEKKEQQQPQQQAPQQQAPQQQARPSANFEPKQRALADKVSAYLTRVQVMSGDFAQVGPDGRRSQGQFYVQKPGKIRFDYDSPSRIDIIADGSSVVVRDRKLATQDVYPLSQTPLRFLLADRIDLLKDTTVTAISADESYVTVVVEEKHVVVGTSKLMMMFGAKDFQLKQWIVTDPQGYDTTVALSNLDTAKRPDPDMFKIDYTQYPN
jgi:outer membrane lipoprotein-sorting protein